MRRVRKCVRIDDNAKGGRFIGRRELTGGVIFTGETSGRARRSPQVIIVVVNPRAEVATTRDERFDGVLLVNPVSPARRVIL